MKTEKLKLDFKKGSVKGLLKVLSFKEGDSFIQYVPSLNISAYGDSDEESSEMLREIIKDYFHDLFELNEYKINGILKDFGWIKSKLYPKRFVSDSFIDKEGVLNNFNLPAETVIKETLIPA